MSLSLLSLLPVFWGCAPDTAGESGAAGPSWNPEIRPVVEAYCLGCHRSGGDALPALDSHAAAAAYGDRMLAAMEEGRMPPAPADPACRSWSGGMAMSEEEIGRFRQWVEAGAPEGAPETSGAIPVGWGEDEPFPADQVAALPGYLPSAALDEEWRCFALPELDSGADRWLTGIALTPSSAATHQMLLYRVPADQRADLEAQEAQGSGASGYPCADGPLGALAAPPELLATWVPGARPERLEDGTARRIGAGDRLVAQVEYRLRGAVPAVDTGGVAIRLWADPGGAPGWARQGGAIRQEGLEILPDTPIARRSLIIPWYGTDPGDTLTLTALSGHMHRLGTSLSLQSGAPDSAGGAGCLLDLAEWNHDWQQRYTLTEPAVLTSGSRLELECTWDNSWSNQPMIDGIQQPSQTVTGGPGGETCLLYAERLIPAEQAGCDRGALEACVAAAGDSGGCAAGCLAAAEIGGDVARCLESECPEIAAACAGVPACR